MKLKLVNNVNKKEYIYSGLTDYNDSKMFYHFPLQLDNNMDDGSYTYYLFNEEDEQVATGNLQIGDYVKTATAYTKNNTYTVYNG